MSVTQYHHSRGTFLYCECINVIWLLINMSANMSLYFITLYVTYLVVKMRNKISFHYHHWCCWVYWKFLYIIPLDTISHVTIKDTSHYYIVDFYPVFPTSHLTSANVQKAKAWVCVKRTVSKVQYLYSIWLCINYVTRLTKWNDIFPSWNFCYERLLLS